MGCLTADAPPPVNYGQQTADTLKAQVALAPAQYSAEAQFAPQYTNLALQNLNTMMNGSATAPGVSQLLAQQNTTQRASDINDVNTLGPAATQAMLNADPYNAQLLGKLNAQANQGLDAGSQLTPDQQRAMQQQSRAAFAARGMGGGNASIADELLKQFDLGQQLLQQRQQFASGVVGTNQQVLGDPFQQITGRNSGAMQAAQGVQTGPSLFNPESALSGAITAGNQQVASLYNSTPTAQAVKNDMPSY